MRLSIRQFQDVTKISESELSELDKSILIVKTLTDKTDFEIERMSAKKFNAICRIVRDMLDSYVAQVDKDKPKKFIRVNGTTYMLHYDITRMVAGKYVEAVTFQQDMIGNLHKLLATMAVPMKWTWRGIRAKPYDATEHSKIAEQMLDADFSVAYHACIFFSGVLIQSIKSLNIYGNFPEMQTMEALEKRLVNYLDGSITANWYQNLKVLN